MKSSLVVTLIFGKHSEHLHKIPMWESEHYTTRVYNNVVDSCEPVCILKGVKRSEELKRKACEFAGGASKRAKKAKVGAVVVVTRSQPEISVENVVPTGGVEEDLEDAVVGAESGELPVLAGEHALAAGDGVNGVVLWDGDSNANAEGPVEDVIDQNAQVIELRISEYVASSASSLEESNGASPYRRWVAELAEECEDEDVELCLL